MSEEVVIQAEELDRSAELDKEVKAEDSKLKELIVNFVGNELDLEETVTVEDIVRVFAEQFPEFVLALAEENFIRGYKQAITDLDSYANQQVEQQAEA
jgi:hypothetical protein